MAARSSPLDASRYDGVSHAEPVAIIGIGCRFPGGVTSPESFWRLLENGVDAITEIPPDRWSARYFVDPDPATHGRMSARYGGFIEGIDQFDPRFFGLAPREAGFMDPQQRLLLEICWEGLEDAGLAVDDLSGSKTGVFVGISTHDYADIQMKDVYSTDFYANTGGALSIASNRLSYLFNFRGPSLSVDTACSSSLVALHLACRSLRTGESDLALAAGVNCILAPEMSVTFSKGSMLSPDGRCQAFDSRANGYVRGEGAGLVVLKPLSRAQEDGDSIYAVILASAVNQDGRTPGMTVPGRAAQETLLREVYREAGVPAARVVYVEAHGTGTPVGDPIEANAIGSVLGLDRSAADPLRIGSVKSNIGHLEAASGVAGLIKAAMVLKHRRIPASLHFDSPNPKIAFESLGLCVPRASEPLPIKEGPAVAGVNSFGFGGTNAHVVLQEAAAAAPTPDPGPLPNRPRAHLVPVSGRTPEALRAVAAGLADFLTDTRAGRSARIEDISYTLGLRRSHLEARAAVVAASREELVDELRSLVETTATQANPAESGRAGKVAFVFSGMGPQSPGMGRELLEEEPVFRRAVERCDSLFERCAGWSVLAALLAEGAQSRMQDAEVAQPANFVLQVGLAELWASWGVVPDAIVGHSAGEVAAAVVAGALSLEDGVRVIYHRSRLQQRATALGRMMAVGLTHADAESAVQPYRSLVSIAAINGRASVTLSGDSEALAAIAAPLAGREVFNRFLDVNVPYHSHYMDPLEVDLLESLSGLDARTASVPLYSTVSGGAVDGEEFGTSYWWSNVRRPVLFAQAIDQLIADGYRTFLEIAPHPVLAHSVREGLQVRADGGEALPSLRRGRERATMLESLGSLYVHGLAISWRALRQPDARLMKLPTYPWQRERCWHESEVSTHFRLADPVHPLLQRRVESPDTTWETYVAPNMPAYLKDHAIHGSVVVPAAAYIEMALTAARELGCEQPILDDIDLKRALTLGRDTVQQLRFSLDTQQSAFAIHSRARESGQPWTLHATGNLRLKRKTPPVRALRLDWIRRRCPVQMSGAECYAVFRVHGLQYGPHFQGLETLWQGRGEALGLVKNPEPGAAGRSDYRCHPALLDACFQVLMGAIVLDRDHASGGTYLPVRIGRVRLHRPATGDRLWSHATLTARRAGRLTGDVSVFDDDGRMVIAITGFTCQHVPDARTADDLSQYSFQSRWYPRALAARQGVRQADDLPRPSRIAAGAPPPAELYRRFDRSRHYDEFEPQLDALCTAYVLEAFRQLGWSPRRGQSVESTTLASRLQIAPVHHKLFGRLLEILAEDGVLAGLGSAWVVARTPKATRAQQDWDTLAELRPDCRPVLDLLGACGPRLADVLRGSQDPLQLLFPGGSMDRLRSFYQDAPSQHVYNYLVERSVAAVVAGVPPGRTLRVLEIGAGTGATTARLLPILPAGRTEYVFTDVSPAFLTAGQRRFGDSPFLQYQILDIERKPVDQGFAPHSFDLILAADVLHATRDLRETLGGIKTLLASEGLLVAMEQVRSDRFLDLVFGLLKDWWRFEDVDVRGNHAWLSRVAWGRLLHDEDFGEIASLCDVPGLREPFQHVLVARGPRVAGGPADDGVAPVLDGAWLVLADCGGVGERLATALRLHGGVPLVASVGPACAMLGVGHVAIRPDSPEDVRELLALAGPDLRGVVHLWSLDAPLVDEAGAPGLESARRLGCTSTLILLQELVATASATPPRVWLVTRGAQQVDDGDGLAAVAQAPLWGLGRVAANEHPQLRPTLVDLDPREGARPEEALWREIVADDAEQEIALRAGGRFIVRLAKAPEAVRAVESTAGRARPAPPFVLEASRPGVLDSLVLREGRRTKPGPNDVEIQVLAAGLNFRDVMKAMGLYPTDDGEDVWLGDECSGKVVRVGHSVTQLRVGDEVVAVAPGALRSFVTVRASQVVRKPEGLTVEEAATIPIVFLTVLYALKHLARLSPGERILIHSAAGGVGLAAVQIAQHVGADVFATAGSPEKREYLRSLGVRHVMDSRSQDFADEVMAITGGKGVGVVLNSLAGEFIPNSMSLLEPAGRFIELGKIDIYQDTKLGLAHFKNGLSFLAVDLGWLLKHRPALASSLLHEVTALFETAVLRPLPVTIFPVAEAASAFRHMAQARHIGKIAMSLTDVAPALVLPSPKGTALVSRKATYLVTGALSGFGLAIAQWLVGHGARHLVLVGRRGVATPEGETAVRRMRAAGAHVEVARVDVTQADQVTALVSDIDRTMPPLRGIFHAAMVLDDGYLTQLNEARFDRVMAPKVTGTWNLHAATLDKRLDYFVLFSSMSSMLGTLGQGNYSAANAFLDAFAHYRRARGLAALTVNWGAIGDVGYVARNADIGRYFERQGLEGLKAAEAGSILEALLRTGQTQVAAIRADFQKLVSLVPSAQWSRRLSHVLPRDAAGAGSARATSDERAAVLSEIRSAAAPHRIDLMESVLRRALGDVLKIPGDRIDPHLAFGSMGLDSLMAVELETLVKGEMGADISLGFLAGGETTLRQLAERLLEQVVPAPAAT